MPPGPHVIVVSIKNQNVTVYGANGETATAPVSTGTRSKPTPTGIFTVIQKSRIHFSNLYGAAPMPNMQRITWSGVAMHAGHLPGYPASHGCIRMPYAFSSKLYAATKMGARVIVTRSDVRVAPFASEHLFAALPEGTEETPTSQSQHSNEVATLVGVTPAEAATAPAERSRASVLAAKTAEVARLTETLKGAEAAQKEAAERNKPAIEAAAEAFKVVRKAKVEGERLEKAARLAERAKAAAEERYAKLNKKAEADGAVSTTAPASDASTSTDVTPDPKLIELTEKARAARESADAQAKVVAEAEAKLLEANANRLKAAADARLASQAVTDAKSELAAAQRFVKRFKEPVSVFISRATGKLYVRHAWDQMLEVPVKIDNPSAPLGHHVFTATEFVPGTTEMKWNVATYTVPAAEPRRSKTSSKKKGKKNEAPPEEAAVPLPPPSTPAEALARIDIPQDVRDRVAELMKPGSSLIISDAPMSNETGKYTDFIVQPRS